MAGNRQTLKQQEAKIKRWFFGSIGVFALIAGIVIILLGLRDKQAPDRRQPFAPNTETVTTPTHPQAPAAAPETHFTDITQQAGIDFVHTNGAYGDRLLPETMGSGAVFFDYDNDGDQDLFLVNFNNWPGHEKQPPPTSKLYANDGTGHFTDVSHRTGLDLTLFGMGAAAGDYNGDGWTDLYIYTLYDNHLLENRHGRFVDVSQQAGVAGGPHEWSSSAAFFDADQDGDLDLLVTNYVHWSRPIDLEIDFRLSGLGRAYGAPTHFTGAPNHLYRNNGDGSFTEITQAAGLQVRNERGEPVGKALGLSLIDYDLDGRLDIFIANDTARNFLFHNQGNGRFEEVGELEGIAYSSMGKTTGAMGIDTGWIYNNDDLAVLIGNFANEMNSLYLSPNGQPPFTDEAVISGIGPDSRLALTFGVLFFDYDLDGRLDILLANGHLEPEINKVQSSQHYAQKPQLFWHAGPDSDTPFIRVEHPGDLDTPLIGRAALSADIDGDGDLDLLITQNGRAARLFRNDQHSGNHWLRIQLNDGRFNPHAIGARIELTSQGQRQRRQVVPTRSYLAQVELPQTFGLGKSAQVDKLEVIWPDGIRQSYPVPGVDRLLMLDQNSKP